MAEVTHFYVENNNLVSDSVTGPAGNTLLVNIDGGDLDADVKYLIIARALIGMDNATDKVGIYCNIWDDTVVREKSRSVYEIQQTGSTSLKSWMFAHSYITDGSPGDIRMGIYRDDQSGTAYGDQASLMLINLDELGFYEKFWETVPTLQQIYGGTGTDEMAAQSFKVHASHDLEYMMLRLAKGGTPTDNVYIEIATTVDGSAIATSDNVAASTIPVATPEPIRFSFSTPPSLTAGTTYFARLVRSGTRDTSNYVNAYGNSNGNYADGIGRVRDNGTWTDWLTDADFNFVASSGAWAESIGADTGDEGDELSATAWGTELATVFDTELGTTDEWLVLGYARLGAGANSYYVRLHGADDASSASDLNYVAEEFEDATELRMVGVAGRHKAITSDVDLAIDAYEEAANGNVWDRGSYLIALKGSAFADFEHDFTSEELTGIATETTIASIGPYTPAINGNHLILGRTQTNGSGAQILMHLEDGTTPTRTGDASPTHDQAWDSSEDFEPAFIMERISISAQKTYNLRGDLNGSGSWNAIDRWLLVLNLNLYEPPVTVYPPFPRRKLTTVRM